MAAEGQNKAASSLLDLQPTAVLELFRVYPDRINKPTLFMGFHGGAIFDKAIKWQGLQYIPLPIESEGFDVLGDGKMARPKIRVANKNYIITNLLQNYKDLTNAKVVRKKVQVKFLDDDNFDGGNPFGIADSKAELLDEEWIMGRKTQESKIFVEFELNSPLDLENFSVNSRGIQARFCYWQYRGEGCRYQGLPIEQGDGTPFRDASDNPIVPTYTPPRDPEGEATESNFWEDGSLVWNTNTEYNKGNIAITKSPTVLLPVGDVNSEGVPLKTVYISVADGNVGNHPERNPSYWQKDGCTKRLSACQKRFNPFENIGTITTLHSSAFPTVRFSGVADPDRRPFNTYTKNKGCFHTTESDVTGTLDPRNEWTLVGWANVNEHSLRGAGIFTTTAGDEGEFPVSRFLNITRNGRWGFYNNDQPEARTIGAHYIGSRLGAPPSDQQISTLYRVRTLHDVQEASEEVDDWHQYVTRHSTGTLDFIQNAALPVDERGNPEDFTTRLEVFVNGEGTQGTNPLHWRRDMFQVIPSIFEFGWNIMPDPEIEGNNGNFASYSNRADAHVDGVSRPCLPQTFMIGAQTFWRFEGVWPDGDPDNPLVIRGPAAQLTTMNGHIGMWGLWNRALNDEEIRFLRTPVITPADADSYFDYIPRAYEDCTGRMSTLTGGTGDGLPDGTAPLLYGKDSLVAWWDGTTGDASIGHGLLDIHTGLNTTLTGSGDFLGVDQSYKYYTVEQTPTPSQKFPNFGGFPGTAGFSYGRDAF